MASTAAHFAQFICDAAYRQCEAVVAFLALGPPQPVMIPVYVHAPQSVSHPSLVRHSIRAANRQTPR